MLQIYNENNVLTFSEKGAELISWKFKEREIIWQADKSIWPRHAPILFPFVGQLKGQKYTHRKREFNMPRHGFIRDMDWKLKNIQNNVIEFEICSSAQTKEFYPFDFRLISKYELNGSELNHALIITNTGCQKMLFGAGAHPAFNILDPDAVVTAECPEEELKMYPLVDGCLLKAPTIAPKIIPIQSNTFDRDALVFIRNNISAITLRQKSYDIKVYGYHIPYWGVWAPKGCTKFVCIEPWWGHADFTDAPPELSDKEDLMCLEPGQSKELQYGILIIENRD
ncbi:MAG: aldose 1-epimerase family protein [Bacteroidia bacterium]|nr:aldose 1-epimerase family protein [Bacteroidia bacterium]